MCENCLIYLVLTLLDFACLCQPTNHITTLMCESCLIYLVLTLLDFACLCLPLPIIACLCLPLLTFAYLLLNFTYTFLCVTRRMCIDISKIEEDVASFPLYNLFWGHPIHISCRHTVHIGKYIVKLYLHQMNLNNWPNKSCMDPGC